MRINAKGQVTIPAALRARAGLTPGTEVAIAWDGNAIRVTPSPPRLRPAKAKLSLPTSAATLQLEAPSQPRKSCPSPVAISHAHP